MHALQKPKSWTESFFTNRFCGKETGWYRNQQDSTDRTYCRIETVNRHGRGIPGVVQIRTWSNMSNTKASSVCSEQLLRQGYLIRSTLWSEIRYKRLPDYKGVSAHTVYKLRPVSGPWLQSFCYLYLLSSASFIKWQVNNKWITSEALLNIYDGTPISPFKRC